MAIATLNPSTTYNPLVGAFVKVVGAAFLAANRRDHDGGLGFGARRG
jgi:hypothetical protein